MASALLSPLLLKSTRPSRLAGVLVAIISVAAATGLIYPLKQVTPVLSLGVLYVLPVVVVSMFWGLIFGVGTSVLSAAAFNFFHLGCTACLCRSGGGDGPCGRARAYPRP
jgi:K+-sensing histidine kinase KdpD